MFTYALVRVHERVHGRAHVLLKLGKENVTRSRIAGSRRRTTTIEKTKKKKLYHTIISARNPAGTTMTITRDAENEFGRRLKTDRTNDD